MLQNLPTHLQYKQLFNELNNFINKEISKKSSTQKDLTRPRSNSLSSVSRLITILLPNKSASLDFTPLQDFTESDSEENVTLNENDETEEKNSLIDTQTNISNIGMTSFS